MSDGAGRPDYGRAKLELGDPRVFVGARNGEWRSRGYVPHFEAGNAIQHVTFRLADSLPKEALERVEWELDLLEKEERQVESRQAGAWRSKTPMGQAGAWRSQSQERRMRIEELMDAGLGSCLLKEPEFARLVEGALKHFDSVRYRLMAWVVMPNHVHVLFERMAPWTMAKVVWSWKAWTGRKILEELKRRKAGLELNDPISQRAKLELGGPSLGGPIWFREYWDRFVRNERHLHNVVDYIHQNPVKAGLVSRAEEWQWSSARVDPVGSV
jgi:REP element-mobilizing transposase RayT